MTAPAFEPAWVGEVELAGPVGDVVAPVAFYRRAQLLVRIHGTPIGLLSVPLEAGACDAATLVRHVREDLGPAVAAHLEYDGLPQDAIGVEGAPDVPAPRCAAPGPHPERADGLASVIVCTRDRPDRLPTTLETILASRRGDLELIVVDNAPQTAAACDIVSALGDPRVRYVLEPRPGLSRARNRGAQDARGRFLVFTDDDVRVDPAWLGRLLNGFSRAPHVGCATGVVLAAELETPAQAYIEQRLDWSAFRPPRIYDLGAHRSDDAMFPFSAGQFGTGANVAVDRETWDALGGLDPLLGTGTPAMGGEDLDLFLRVLLDGRALAVESSAVVWHWHHRTVEQLRRQQRGYGAGLAAYATKHLLDRRTALQIARRTPGALKRMTRDTRSAGRSAAVEDELSGIELRGLLTGSRRYLASRVRARREVPAP